MFESMEQRRERRWRRLKIGLWTVLALLAALALYEFTASPLQAMFLADYAKRLTYKDAPGPSRDIRFPEAGPYNQRLGYAGLPGFSQRLQERGFEVVQQARISPQMAQLDDYGLFLPYREKPVAGLQILDSQGQPLFTSRYPRHSYADFKAVPPVVANTLLFIENRELLDPNHPRRNPAVEWDRLAQAVLEKGMQIVDPGRNVPGGSTLATQIEKYRHSPDGLTMTASDKLTQMASASVRAYLDGTDTRVTRQRIVLDYLNTVPLAAAPGHGEVHGVGDALQAWFGLDFDEVNRLLVGPEPSVAAARAYKHVLGLLISQRKPSYYLLSGRNNLNALANVHLRLLADAGVITPRFRDLALEQHIHFIDAKERASLERPSRASFVENKATNAIRVELGQMLKVPRMYDLDRLDLTVDTTLDGKVQRTVSQFLQQLDDPVVIEARGLYGQYLLSPENDLKKPIYSFTLYELTQDGAYLRIQADNLNQPFDINQGAKLDMGSSAKLRTLITYLSLVAELHSQYAWLKREELLKQPIPERDGLSRWVVQYLINAQDRSLTATLQAAMGRMYSASPAEPFFTGGGLHTFANFNKDDNGKVMDLWEATRNSVNLPFIRLMRDIVHHLIYRAPGTAAAVLADPANPKRKEYLEKFADKEGREFLARFHKKYKGLSAEETTDKLLNHLAANPRRLAAVYRYIRPHDDPKAFSALMRARLANPGSFDDKVLAQLYEAYGPEKFSLSDRGYIAQIHPLELWLVGYLNAHPKAAWSDIVSASARERVDVYQWLFTAAGKNAQDNRILSRLEIDAFEEIHRRWRKLGYPFASLVPSYATAIGSSADRPAALAELVGVILNDGVKLPSASLERLDFAAGTPYHTVFKRKAGEGERIFPAAVAQVLRQALTNVVQEGTARRLRGSYVLPEGAPIVIGGKTGTGDHRFETYSPGGQLLESKVMNRVATFAFFMGSRFYGVMTVLVPGEAAKDYHFTSGLPVQLVKLMEPALLPMIAAAEARHRVAEPAPEPTPAPAEPPPAPAEPPPTPKPAPTPGVTPAPQVRPEAPVRPVVPTVTKPVSAPPAKPAAPAKPDAAKPAPKPEPARPEPAKAEPEPAPKAEEKPAPPAKKPSPWATDSDWPF